MKKFLKIPMLFFAFFILLSACVLEKELEDNSNSNNVDPVSCTEEFAPVCSNGVEFSNSCMAEASGVVDYVKGSCQQDIHEIDSTKIDTSKTEICPEIRRAAIGCGEGGVIEPVINGTCVTGYLCVPDPKGPEICPLTDFFMQNCPIGQVRYFTMTDDCIDGQKCVQEPITQPVSKNAVLKLNTPERSLGHLDSNLTIKSQEELDLFLATIPKSAWSNAENEFVTSLRAQKIDWGTFNLIIYNHTEGSGSVKVTVDEPIWKSTSVFITINRDVPEIGTTDMAYYTYVYKVSKKIENLTFEVDSNEIVVPN